MTKSKPFYVKLINKRGGFYSMLEFWHYDTVQEAVAKYFFVKKSLNDYIYWKIECDDVTAEKVNEQEYL